MVDFSCYFLHTQYLIMLNNHTQYMTMLNNYAHREADLDAVVRVHQWVSGSTAATTATIATTPARHSAAVTVTVVAGTIVIQKAVTRAVDDRYRGPPAASTASGCSASRGCMRGGARGVLWRPLYYAHCIVLRSCTA
jgi:hypothetical protein